MATFKLRTIDFDSWPKVETTINTEDPFAAETYYHALNHIQGEYVIDFILGSEMDKAVAVLARHRGLTENFELWIEVIQHLTFCEKAAICYLLDDLSMNLKEAIESRNEVCLFIGLGSDYAYTLAEEIAGKDVPPLLLDYFDAESCASDMRLNGEISTFVVAGTTFTVTNCLDL